MKVLKILAVVIGILIVLAVAGAFILQPHFKRFQTKSKQVAGKSILTGMYASQAAYNAEYGSYTADLNQMGFMMSPSMYKMGFVRAEEAASGSGDMTAKDTDQLVEQGKLQYDPIGQVGEISFQSVAEKHCPDCVATKDGFKMVAFSNLDDDETLDIWTIDQDKNLVNVVDDVEN